ncbi:MAG: hypothetical protein HQM08_18360 [Candidatus Riflebacteria bacterium]|nr:hypothetical protein [Candidatus Riflebacteria bacterium]
MWKNPRADGFVELENGFVNLLKSENGKLETKTISYANKDVWSILKIEIPTFFAPGSALTFISSYRGGLKCFSYPSGLTEGEIINNLQLKREELLGIREELVFQIRMQAPGEDKKRDVYASYIPRSILESTLSLCETLGYPLRRFVTGMDAMLGAFQKQLGKPVKAPFVIIQVGYSQVNIAVWKEREILSVRSILTGSYREMENDLSTTFSISWEDFRQMLAGIIPITIPAIQDAITNARQELMTHIGALFATLRGKKLVTEETTIFLSQPYIVDPNLPKIISERFAIGINILTGADSDEMIGSPELLKLYWLTGANFPNLTNLVPKTRVIQQHLYVNPRVAFLAAMILSIAPLPILRLAQINVENEVEKYQAGNAPCQKILGDLAKIAEMEKGLDDIVNVVASDLHNRGVITRLSRKLTENLPAMTRLERLELNLTDKRIFLTGFTIDTETALRFLDYIRSQNEISSPEISFSDLESRKIKFEITASIGGGGK